jgi:hypothetical protein
MWLLIVDFEYVDIYTDTGLNGGSVCTIFIITIFLPGNNVTFFLFFGKIIWHS